MAGLTLERSRARVRGSTMQATEHDGVRVVVKPPVGTRVRGMRDT